MCDLIKVFEPGTRVSTSVNLMSLSVVEEIMAPLVSYTISLDEFLGNIVIVALPLKSLVMSRAASSSPFSLFTAL